MRATILAALLAVPCFAQQTAAQWIWYPEQPASDCIKESRWFRKTFEVPGGVQAPALQAATLWLLVDDQQKLWVNGRGDLPVVESGRAWHRYDLGGVLQPGRNVIAVQGTNGTGPAGVLARLVIQRGGAQAPALQEMVVSSDASWRSTKTEPPAGWTAVAFDDSQWQPVRVIGSAFIGPWFDHALFDVSPFIALAERAAEDQRMAALLAPPERFAREQPARATIQHHNGAPALFINGAPRPLVMYRGTVDPVTEQGRHIIGQFRDAGIHGYAPYIALDRCWTGPGQYNWKPIDEQVRAYLSVDPDAYLDILVRLVPPGWWFEAHPDEMVRYATSDDIDSNDEAERVLRPSLASEAWLRDVGEAWTALIRHMENQPWGKRVIGWHACYGIYAEWHYFGSWTQQYPDTGAAMTKAFRAHLRRKYGTDARLQAAWGERGTGTNVPTRIDTAEVPGVEPRRNATLASFRDAAREQRVIDYYRCQQQITADAIEHFGKLAKQATNHRAIYGIYYGYFMGVLPQTQGGHLELPRLLQSPHIDYLVAPYDYGNRLMGQDGRLRSLPAAFNLAGKAHIIEADTRTFLHGRNEYGRTANLTESLAAIRREFSTGLIEHTGYWYVDFGPESRGGWFDHPEIMAAIKQLYGLAERAGQTPRKSVAEVALVCDLDSAYTLSDGEGMLTAYKLITDTVGELYRTGTPFDAILLPQLAQADLSRYKVLVFLNATAMSDRQAAQVRKLREAGKHALVFVWAPGYTGPDGVSADRVREATGFRVQQTALRAPGRMVVTAPDHPLTAALPAAQEFTIQPVSATAVPGFGDVANWHNPRSPVFMEEHYQQFDLAPADGGVTWTLQTKDSWSDVHWQGELAVRDGLGLEAMASSRHPQLNLRAVIKDANLAEFVSPAVTLPAGERKTLHLPLQAFTNAPWAQVRPERPALPLQGMKFVIDGLANAGPITVQMRNLSLLTGEVRTTPVRRFGEGMFGPLVTPVAEPGVQVLGHIEGREDGLLAVRGQGRALTLYCPVPFLPREVLSAVLREAGVHVYDPDSADVVRADSRFVAIHTAPGGPRRLAFPGPVTVQDALSGQRLGTGPALDLTLPPNSTTLLEITNP